MDTLQVLGFTRPDGTMGVLNRRYRRIATRIELADRAFFDRHSSATNFFARPFRPGERELGEVMGTPARPGDTQMFVYRHPNGVIDRMSADAERLERFTKAADWIGAYRVEVG